jgi:hypothetical protein
MKLTFVFMVTGFLMLGSCSRQQTAARAMFDTSAWKVELSQFRRAQDSFLRFNAESPLRNRAPEARLVQRFEPDPAYRVLAVLDRTPRREPWLLATSKGDSRRMLRLGYLNFQLLGRDCKLAAFAYEEDPKQLFIPFLDSSNGVETYKAGRYLDLRDDGSGKVWLDFNRAYHPYCAYNADYSCPLVPSENRLKLAVRVGEGLRQDTLSWE